MEYIGQEKEKISTISKMKEKKLNKQRKILPSTNRLFLAIFCFLSSLPKMFCFCLFIFFCSVTRCVAQTLQPKRHRRRRQQNELDARLDASAAAAAGCGGAAEEPAAAVPTGDARQHSAASAATAAAQPTHWAQAAAGAACTRCQQQQQQRRRRITQERTLSRQLALSVRLAAVRRAGQHNVLQALPQVEHGAGRHTHLVRRGKLELSPGDR